MSAEPKRKANGDANPKAPKASKKKEAPKSQLKFKNPAEFFRDNKNIAGFDNPGKSLFTSLREFIENSLDAAEAINVLPNVSIVVEEIPPADFNDMVGVVNKGRVDSSLYADYHEKAAADRKKAKSKKTPAATDDATGAAAAGGDEDNTPTAKAGRGTEGIYRITVKDNGSGVKHDDIPNSFGRVLAGTKYGVKQTRGKFGLGSKMALIWAQMSTTMPIRIRSATKKTGPISEFKLKINFEENCPVIEPGWPKKLPNEEGWQGTEIDVIIKGNWTTYRGKIIHYLRQLAIITPYAEMDFHFRAAQAKATGVSNNLRIKFARRSDQMPLHAKEVKYHPRSVNAVLLQELISNTKHATLEKFLEKEFSNTKKEVVLRLIDELGDEFYPEMPVADLQTKHVNGILQLLQAAQFSNPSGDHLSPAGEYNLRLGIMKELNPEMVATYEEPCHDFEGHAFIVEAGVSLGGKLVKPGVNVYRFANRIPLLFEAGSDVTKQTAYKRINWASYKINKAQDKIGVFVSVVSTKIPFKGTGKEYIGDDVEEYKRAVRAAITGCCVQLKKKLARAHALKAQGQRKKDLQRYIQDVSRAIFKTCEAVKERADTTDDVSPAGTALQRKLADRQVTEAILRSKLETHVDQIDAEQALEYEVSKGLQSGVKQAMWIVPMTEKTHEYLEPIHSDTVKMLLLK